MSTESNVHANDAHSIRVPYADLFSIDGGCYRGVGGLIRRAVSPYGTLAHTRQ